MVKFAELDMYPTLPKKGILQCGNGIVGNNASWCSQ